MNVKSILGQFKKAGALGVGAVGGEAVSNFINNQVPTTEGVEPNKALQYVGPGATIILSGFLGKSKGMANIASGMMAGAAAKAIKTALPDEVKSQIGLAGDDVLLGFDQAPLMGMDQQRFDFTSEASGEASY